MQVFSQKIQYWPNKIISVWPSSEHNPQTLSSKTAIECANLFSDQSVSCPPTEDE